MGVVRYNGIGMVTEAEFNTGLAGKLDKPDVEGTTGQVLTKTSGGGEEWATIPETGTPADDEMKDDSTNAVQNQVIKAYVDAGDAALDEQKANKDGYYEQLVAGASKNLEAPITTTDTFLVRPTGGEETEAADGVAQITEAEGNSVKFNQLVPKNGFTTRTDRSVTYTNNFDGSVTVNGTATGGNSVCRWNYSFVSGHKYYIPQRNSLSNVLLSANNTTSWNKHVVGVFTASTQTAVIIGVTEGTTADNEVVWPMLLDLTDMGIDNLTTVDAVEAWLAENIGAMAYYPYTAGTVLNNSMVGIEAPGYNLLDPATGKAQIIGAYSDLYGNYYGIVGTHGTLTFTDAYGNSSTITPDADGKFELTVPGELSVASAGADCAVFLWWDGTKKEYEPYELNHGYLDVTHIYGKLNGEGSLVQTYAAGMAAIGDDKDYLHNVDGAAVADVVIGSRAYTSGDESDSTVITDGTTTYYHLTTELRYTNLVYQGSSYYADGTPVVLPVNYKVSNWSIESILPKNTSSALVTAPAALTCKYSLGAVDLLNTHTDEIADLYDKKADKDGTYPDLISGNLIDGNGVGTDQEIMFRPTGGGQALAGNGNAIIQTIKGRTLVWNQLVQNGNFANGVTGFIGQKGTIAVADNILTFTAGADVTQAARIETSFTLTVGHKYLFAVDVLSSKATGIRFLYSGFGPADYQINVSANVKARCSKILDISEIPSEVISLYVNATGVLEENDTVAISNYICIDLTRFFNGSVPQGYTAADFMKDYPELYYATNAGTLLPFKGTGIKVTGFNQWDEQWEVGLLASDGKVNSDAGNQNRRTTSFIPVIPGANYFTPSQTFLGRYAFYTANKTLLAYDGSGFNSSIFTIPANAHYLRITFPASYGTTYNNDICINISNPALNGTYKPYTEALVNIDAIGKSAKDADGNAIVPFPEGMNGTPTNYDVARKADGEKVMGVVDLGSLTWLMYGTGDTERFQSIVSDKKYGYYNIICGKYATVTENTGRGSSVPAGYISGGESNNQLYVKNSEGYADAAAFKAAMAGVKLVYELATPVPFTWDTPLDLIYPAPAGGTEMLLPQGVDESGVPATTPMDATIFYSKDYVQTINDMPKDFDTTASIDALATALATTLSTALDGTFTITRGAYDATNKKYAWTVTFTSNAEEE